MKQRAQSGKSPSQLKEEFVGLLAECHAEQTYQDFIERNTRLVPREFVQNHGIHFNLVLRKLAFGADYIMDFGYLSKSSDDWNCVLVELEKPGSQFFKKGSNNFHPNFVDALQQVNKWKAWFLNSNNKDGFINGTLGLVRVPLAENPTFMKYVLVFGRRSEYVGNTVRRRLIAAQEADDFKILTFDSLAEGLEVKRELYVGARKNEYVQILSNEFVEDSIFAWMEPEQLQISNALRNAILAARNSWSYVKSFATPKEFSVEEALKRVRITE
jgi:Domain of unknown function (DUF4263)